MSFLAVFDLDGTLVDSAPLTVAILCRMLADRGAAARVTLARARRHISVGGEAMILALVGEACGPPAEAVVEFRARLAATPTPPSSLYRGVRAGLGRLFSRGVGLAVHSNKPQALCEKVLGELGLSHLFDAVVGGGAGSAPKPDPLGFDKALALTGASRAASCYIGDSELDHGVAQRAGVPFVLARYGYGEENARFPGAFVAGRFAEVPPIVERLLAAPRERAA
ncbi:MAG: HAD hydrolase-like protein, partial [Pseudomonadota bacterium]